MSGSRTTTPARRDWDAEEGPTHVHRGLAEEGIAWVRAPRIAELAARDPYLAVERLLGEPPVLLERQPIRPIPEGRSFASGRMATPFHTDSQMLFGVPPHVQVMACGRAAEQGGESVYLDAWALLERLEREDVTLLDALFAVPRRQPFVFGDVLGPTVTLRGHSLVFTHSPRPLADDAVAARLRPHVESADVIEVKAETGDVVVIHNHRLLHGRRAFDDVRRSFTRILAWRRDTFPSPPRWRVRGARVAEPLDERLAGVVAGLRDGVPISSGEGPIADRRFVVVREMIGGAPPGLLSAREGVPEPEIYGWRDAVLAATVRPGRTPAPPPGRARPA